MGSNLRGSSSNVTGSLASLTPLQPPSSPSLSGQAMGVNLRSSGSLSSSLGIHNPPVIEGGIVFEYPTHFPRCTNSLTIHPKPTLKDHLTYSRYYSANNCGLLTYLIVHRNYRGQGLDRVLVESALEILDQNAKDKG